MTKKITIRIEFKDKGEIIKFDAHFRAEFLRYDNLNEPIADYAITPINSEKCFADEEMNALLSEFDEKLKSYEILGIEEI